jgi:hypothetical protein
MPLTKISQNIDYDKEIHYDSRVIQEVFNDFLDKPVWVAMKITPGTEKDAKMPFNPNTGKAALSNNPKTCGSLLETLIFIQKQKGKWLPAIALWPGFNIVAIDLDRVVEDGQITKKEAEAIVKEMGTYTEISQSGQGLHLFCIGTKSGKSCKKNLDGWDLEIYDQARFMIVTGKSLGALKPLRKANKELANIYHGYFKDTEKQAKKDLPKSPKLTDPQVLTLLNKEKNSERVNKLLNEGKRENNDESSMDQTIVNKLTFYTQDMEQVVRIFYNSHYYKTKSDKHKEKWSREDYRQRTFDKALVAIMSYYQPKKSNDIAQAENIPMKKLREGLIPEERFPVELLPIVMRDIVQNISKDCDSDPAISGSAAQSIAAIALRKSVTVIEKMKPKIWHYLSFFHAVVGASAEARKTSNTQPLLTVLERYHCKKKEKYKKDQHAYKNAKKVAEAIIKDIQKPTSPGSLQDKAIQAAEIEYESDKLKPNFYRLFSTDITGPAFYQRLDETEGCYSIFTTDAGDLIDFIIGNKQSGTNDMVFVKLITRDHIHIDRVGTDRKGVEIDIPDPCGNIFIMTQEERWDRFTNHPRLLGSGLHGRCNPIVLPPREKGYIENEEEGEVPTFEEEVKPWDTMIEEFLNFEGNIILSLSKEATKRRRELNNEWQSTVGINQENYDVKDIVHRFVSECVKRAALFHVCDNWNKLKTIPKEIPLATFVRATAVQKYYLQQALNNRRGTLNKIESREIERFVSKWIEKIETKKELVGPTSPRELQQYLHMNKEKLEKFLGELEECDLLEKIAKDGKRAARYTLNVERAKAYIK